MVIHDYRAVDLCFAVPGVNRAAGQGWSTGGIGVISGAHPRSSSPCRV